MSAVPTKATKQSEESSRRKIDSRAIQWNEELEYAPWLYSKYMVLEDLDMCKELVDTADDNIKHKHIKGLLEAAKAVLTGYELDELIEYIKAELGGSILSNELNEHALAEEILRKNNVYLPREYSNIILVYKNGFYQKRDKNRYLKKIIIENFEEREATSTIKTKKINLIKTIIESKIMCELDEFYQDRNWLNLKNGLLNLDKLPEIEFIKHTEEIKTLIQLPVEFSPFALNPKTDKFIGEVVGEDKKHIIYKFIGDVLSREIKHEKALVLYGDGANGKSTLLRLIAELVGEKNYSKVSLHEIAHDQFALGDLQDRILNMHDDLPKNAIKYTANFKTVVTEERIMGEQKYESRYLFRNLAKHIFACNKVPRSLDDTKAFFRRLILILCKLELSEDEKDPWILEKIASEREMSGLLNRALLGLVQLREKGYESDDYEKTREAWMRLSKPILGFADQCCEVDEGLMIKQENLLDAYNKWAREHELQTQSKYWLSRHLGDEFGIETKRKQQDGVRSTYYLNISLKENITEVNAEDLSLSGMRIDDLFENE